MTPRKIDARLVARAAEGDNEAFERLKRRHKNEQAMWLAVVALAIARDENAYTLIYLHHKPVVWECACKTLRKYADVGEFDHQAEAEEALQRTFSKAFRRSIEVRRQGQAKDLVVVDLPERLRRLAPEEAHKSLCRPP